MGMSMKIASPHCAIFFPSGGDFLEVGCGLGIYSINIAKSRDAFVTALDLFQPPVDATIANGELNGLKVTGEPLSMKQCKDEGFNMRVLKSDVFSALPKGEKFDQIFWCYPYGSNPDLDNAGEVGFDMEMFQAKDQYSTLVPYIKEGLQLLKPEGRLFLMFSFPIGCMKQLLQRVAECNAVAYMAADIKTPTPPWSGVQWKTYIVEVASKSNNE